MRKIDKILGLGFLVTLLALSCRKIDVPVIVNTIDLGITSTATSISTWEPSLSATPSLAVSALPSTGLPYF